MEFASNRDFLEKSVPIHHFLHYLVYTNGDTIKMRDFTSSSSYQAEKHIFLLVVLMILTSTASEVINAEDVLTDQTISNIRINSIVM